MKSDQKFIDEIYEKAKHYAEEKPVKKSRRKQRIFVSAAAIAAIILISFPLYYSDIFFANGDTINNKENMTEEMVHPGVARTSIEEKDIKIRSAGTFFTFYGTITKIKKIAKKRIVFFLVEVNPDTGDPLFEGETLELLDIHNLVNETLIGTRLKFEVTQEGEEYQIDNFNLIE